ncbi:hypothetical protein [Paenibacillus oceani]|uniref:Uncharacterized protein n=1 Tax=Paenibacillus oceani TaxID=2772510 RepID=A0A927CCG3_9BACL|nr:hypothetical protein [Paenibacillus oceani]MBD2864128.1 hypothetical protein [Paenibacillus oceani]
MKMNIDIVKVMEQLGLDPAVLEQVHQQFSRQKQESARPSRVRPGGLSEGNEADVCEDAG